MTHLIRGLPFGIKFRCGVWRHCSLGAVVRACLHGRARSGERGLFGHSGHPCAFLRGALATSRYNYNV